MSHGKRGACHMALTFGVSPFGPSGGTLDFDAPEHVRYWEPWPRRMRAMFAGATVLDSRRGVMLHETGAFPIHYFPFEDLRADLLEVAKPGGHAAHQWSVRVGDRVAAACIIGAPGALDAEDALAGHVSIEYGAMDRWFEEDEPVYAHPRDPYHRVDVRASSRHVIVCHRGQRVAESRRPKLLFETSNPVRYYLPFDDVHIEMLDKSETVSECPYKGDGQHWHLRVGSEQVRDAAWSLPHPLPEGIAATEHVCFYPSKVEVWVDGERVVD
jgi:uncharacterized protein (DUF427 family)